MKTYLVWGLITSSIWLGLLPVAVAKPKFRLAEITTVVAPTITPAAALHRLIVAEKLDASWFTPELLKAVDKNSDVNALQLQRDVTMKLGRFRYGNYKSVQPIGGDKYRVLFDRAEPDAVIVKLLIDVKGRIASVGISEKNKPEPNPQAQASAAIALDKSFRTNTRANGEVSPILTSLKQWLGNYQKVQKVDATNYVGIFDRGSAPVKINFKSDGSIENYQMGCPITKSLSRITAPANLQKILADCPNLK